MEKNIDLDTREARAALMLAALGNETRLRIYRVLVRAGRDGLNVGDVQTRLQIPASTLSHHITALRDAGFVAQRREGRALINSVNYDTMDSLLGYLTEECCADETQQNSYLA